MKILFIFHTTLIKGGASKSGLTLVEGLRRLGHDVMAVCPGEGTLSEMLHMKGIPTYCIRFDWAYPYFHKNAMGVVKYLPVAIRNAFINRHALKQLTRFAEDFRPDIIHTNTSVTDMGVKIASAIGVPHITHFREFGFSDCNAVMLHKKRMMAYPRQHAIAIGGQILDYHSLVDGARDRLIYNGIIADDSCRINPADRKYFLFAGSLYKAKGIEDLLEAYAAVPEDIRKKFKLRVAGSTVVNSYDEFLRKKAAGLGISDNVEWLGERSDVPDLMYGARALIVPSHNEAFGRIVVEGMQNGCVVIGRDKAGVREQFDNGVRLCGKEIGLRFDSTVSLTNAMLRVASTPFNEFLPMIEKSQKVVDRLYTTRQYIENVDRFYNDIIKENQNPK